MSTCGLTLADVTFAVTAFERPHLLVRLVQSIRRRYPAVKIIVADNGRRKATLPSCVQVFHLPFDCGLSTARNFLASKVKTSTMLLLEEDFLFLPSTRIEPLVSVLNDDPEVGVVGGAMMGGNGEVSAFSMDIELFRNTMYLRESSHRHRITSRGQAYRLCDVILNFALFRREMLLDQPWDETLKVGEHTPYFNEVKRHQRWRVACCCDSVVYHVPDQRSQYYNAYRQRASGYFQKYLQRNGLDRCVRETPQRFENAAPVNPDIIVLGVGHSGTTVLAKMLHEAGWEPGDADAEFGESVTIRASNQHAMQHGTLPSDASTLLHRFPRPWAIKDPRFVDTLKHWMPIFAKLKQPPMLVMIRRNHDDVVESYRRRKATGDLDALVSRREHQCDQQFASWPWSKLVVEYENLSRAASLFRIRVQGELPDARQVVVAHQATWNRSHARENDFLLDGSPIHEEANLSRFHDSSGEESSHGSSYQSFTISPDRSIDPLGWEGSADDLPLERWDDGSV